MMDINFIFWFIISLAPKIAGQFVTRVYVHVQNWSSFVTRHHYKTFQNQQGVGNFNIKS